MLLGGISPELPRIRYRTCLVPVANRILRMPCHFERPLSFTFPALTPLVFVFVFFVFEGSIINELYEKQYQLSFLIRFQEKHLRISLTRNSSTRNRIDTVQNDIKGIRFHTTTTDCTSIKAEETDSFLLRICTVPRWFVFVRNNRRRFHHPPSR